MFTLTDILQSPQARVSQHGSTDFSRAVISSKDATAGSLFVALRGDTRDGHEFVSDAIDRGASGVLVSRKTRAPQGVTVIEASNTLEVLQDLATTLRRRQPVSVVAITGSAGKTTTKDMVAHVLERRYRVLKSEGSHNNHLGVPLTVSALEPAHSHVVLEIGTSGRGEIDRLARLVGPDVGIVTNIGYAHIGNFGSREEIALEKSSLFGHVTSGGRCIFNGDDERLVAITQVLRKEDEAIFTSIGFGASNDLRVETIYQDENGISCVIKHAAGGTDLFLNMVGRHSIYSALFAVAVGLHHGIDVGSSAEALRSFSPPSGRSALVRVRSDLLVLDDSYNASPDAMLAAIDLLDDLPAEAKVAVLGGMRELGQAEQELHTSVGRRVAQVASHLVTVGPGGSLLLAAARSGGLAADRSWSARSAREALDLTRRVLRDSEVKTAVLVKGARFTHMERVSLGLNGAMIGCGLASCRLYINCAKCPQLEVEGDGPEQEYAARQAVHR